MICTASDRKVGGDLYCKQRKDGGSVLQATERWGVSTASDRKMGGDLYCKRQKDGR